MINVNDETADLKTVVLGTAESFGGTPELENAYDPKSRQHIKNGTFPKEADLIQELDGYAKVLQKHGVEVYRPQVIADYNQIFSRDIGFAIDDKFVKPCILQNRQKELEGIVHIIDQMNPAHVLETPDGARVEGGDVMPWKDHLFVGYSRKEDFEQYIVARTNEEGVDFLRENFPHRTVKAFELNKSDDDPMENALHLDCCFQPIGTNEAIIYKGGFKHVADYEYLISFFGSDHVIEITKEEMYEMNSNVFSISPTVIVSDLRFERLNAILKDRGFTVEAIDFSEAAKMEGLLRCATMPLFRKG